MHGHSMHSMEIDEIDSSREEKLSLVGELWASTDLLFQSQLNWLLILGPLAVVGDATNTLSEAMCFALSGIALIPCAERYVLTRMFDTELVVVYGASYAISMDSCLSQTLFLSLDCLLLRNKLQSTRMERLELFSMQPLAMHRNC
jgi:hypothetical protein